jgi:histidine triad (HIT) family protein
MASIFSQIILGDIPSYKIAENAHCIAFLDINPNTVGHTLCVPKVEVDKFYQMSGKEYLELMRFAKIVATAIEKAIPCKRVGLTIIGLEVPHTHIHLLPLVDMVATDFTKKIATPSVEEFQATADRIASFIPDSI